MRNELSYRTFLAQVLVRTIATSRTDVYDMIPSLFLLPLSSSRLSRSLLHNMSDLQLLHLLNQPLLRRSDGLLDLFRLGTRALSRGLLAAGLATNDLGNSGRPLLGGDALGGEILRSLAISHPVRRCLSRRGGETMKGKVNLPCPHKHRAPRPRLCFRQRHTRSSPCPWI